MINYIGLILMAYQPGEGYIILGEKGIPFDIHFCLYLCIFIKLFLHTVIWYQVGVRGVMVIVVGNGHGDTSSNPGRDWLHFT